LISNIALSFKTTSTFGRKVNAMQTKEVVFHSEGAKLAGVLYGQGVSGKRVPGVLVMGSWLTVKEQMPSNYAPFVADAGCVAMTFDFRRFGASDGQPREVESPRAKAEDIGNAAMFLRTRPEVDPERIGVLAICASAGYAALALLDQPAIKSVAMVAPWLHDAEILRPIYGGEAGVADRLAKGQAAREHYVRTGLVDYVPAASNTDATAAMYAPGDALDYYLNPARGRVPQWGGRFAVMAWKEWLEFDPIALADRISTPIRIVTSEASATPGGARKFADRLKGPHDVVWGSGTQFDFYDQPATVSFAAHHAIDHLSKTLTR
jgi:dienelactone hydrolase